MKYLILILLCSNIFAQKNPSEILDRVNVQFEKIEDYTVDVKVKIDVDFLRVPETEAKIYFKQPDMVKFTSDGFALLPKQGLNFSPANLLNFDFDAIYVKEDTLQKSIVDVIKIIPKSDTANIVLSTLWIDQKENVVKRIISTTRNSGTFRADLNYGESTPLPSKIKFEFNIENMELPPSMSGEFENPEPKKGKDGMKGSVIITYGNYKINDGIPDEIFEENGD